eukprot:m.3627 g.3627  ORF g.3627 m.3627 type:complete len:145 (+) comp2804_c0_seq2:38-472(+)
MDRMDGGISIDVGLLCCDDYGDLVSSVDFTPPFTFPFLPLIIPFFPSSSPSRVFHYFFPYLPYLSFPPLMVGGAVACWRAADGRVSSLPFLLLRFWLHRPTNNTSDLVRHNSSLILSSPTRANTRKEGKAKEGKAHARQTIELY